MIRTRFAPSPTGYMHIGNLRTALYEYLIAKHEGGKFLLRIEDTDVERFVEGATDVIYNTLKLVNLAHDEGPDVGGPFGPYIQSERKGIYMDYAKKLIASGAAYYCFCTKERLESLPKDEAGISGYDNHCRDIEPTENLEKGLNFVIRQKIPQGQTTFNDLVFGEITVENTELDDQVLIKSDSYPTYNFANVVDDHLMEITHVVRGVEYLSSAPKYNLLYEAFGWEIPHYVHLSHIVNQDGAKLSKRRGDASFEDLLAMGYLPEAILNYIALLGWSPGDTQEFFTLNELIKAFDIKGLSKSPSAFDITKLTWMNGEYFKKMEQDRFYKMALPILSEVVKKDRADYKALAQIVKTRINLLKEIPELLDFVDALPDYSTELYNHKKMKTDESIALESLKKVITLAESLPEPWENDAVFTALTTLAEKEGLKNGQILWPVRTALTGKASSPCGASELMVLFGKDESIRRMKKGVELLGK